MRRACTSPFGVCPGFIDAMQTDADLIILGGGCAGLSLAMRLAARGSDCPRVAIVEQRELYERDRSWSYWRTPGARLTHLARREWPAVRLSAGGRSVSVDCRAMPYQTIDSGDFYAEAWGLIRRNPRIAAFLGESVMARPVRMEGVWRVETSRRALRGATVIDTRPPLEGSETPPQLWQSFSGVEVECPEGTFADDQVTLMDFEPDVRGSICFRYVLPYSATRALVEATVFSPERRTAAELAPELARFVARTTAGRATRLIHQEYHAIPMGTSEPLTVPLDGWVRVGLHSGAARAATGYAFQRIQRWADVAAEYAARGRTPEPLRADPWITRRMDSLFLDVLCRQPERAPGLFLGLFALPDPGPVLRFLSDEARLMDYLKVMRSLPAGLFLREAWRRVNS
jgi:lycopene beta-cyclase